MVPYYRTDIFTVAAEPTSETSESIYDSGQTVFMPCPGRCKIEQLTLVNLAGDEFTARLYNRTMVGPLTKIKAILNNNGFCQLVFSRAYPVNIADVLGVTGAVLDTYNTHHRVTGRLDDWNVITDVAFAVPEYAASAFLDIPKEEWPLFQVGPLLTSADGAIDAAPAMYYVNNDPQPLNGGLGFNRILYVEIDTAGVYRTALKTIEGTMTSGG